MATEKDQERAKDQAKAQYDWIVSVMAAADCDYGRLEELKDQSSDGVSILSQDEVEELADLKIAAGGYDSGDDAVDAARDNALSVEVRSGWAPVGDALNPEEFNILLCTGGPAVRIVGELDGDRQPCRAWIEYQDWFMPWTQYFEADQGTLLRYCSLFYFGE